MNPMKRSKSPRTFALLLGSASISTLVAMTGAQAQTASTPAAMPLQQIAQATGANTASPAGQTVVAQGSAVPEQVLITGSLIHGSVVVGVPPMSFSDGDFKESAAVTIADLFRNVPAIYEIPQNDSATGTTGYISRDINVNLRNLSMRNARQLFLVDGIQIPQQGKGGCQTDPSIIPQLAVERVDLLVDGASATYGSAAITGVINVILKRGYDGAMSQFQINQSNDLGHEQITLQQLYGRTWDGGDVTVSLEWYYQNHTGPVVRPYYTANYFAYQGVDNRMALINSNPGIISLGTPTIPAGSPVGFPATTGTNCNNCYGIPHQNGVGLTWAAILANNPTSTSFAANERNLWLDAWTEPTQQRAAQTITFDQKITPSITFFADGWVNVRQAYIQTVVGGNSLSVTVPTNNPFYPTGAPSGLRVNYNFNQDYRQTGVLSDPGRVTSNEIDGRFDLGFNIDLPYDWFGKIYGAQTHVHEQDNTTGTVSANMVTAALGGTVAAVASSSAQQVSIGSFTKPANIPYLNLFCDPFQFHCNDPATINYISSFAFNDENEVIDQFGVNADGPVYDLPAGTIKAAVGGAYQRWGFRSAAYASNAATTAIVNQTIQFASRNIWSAFAQVNIPLLGNTFALPLVKSLSIEGAVRYDRYSDFGSTTNPKVSINWDVGYGLTMRGTFGTSFRAPQFQEQATSGPGLINITNTGTVAGTIQTCPVIGAVPVPGTAAAALAGTVGNCPQYIAGLSSGFNPDIREPGFKLTPETAQNLNLGFEFAPTDFHLKGLDIQMSYWYLRIRNVINNYYGTINLQSNMLDNTIWSHTFLTPANDPKFAQDVLTLLSGPKSSLPITLAPLIKFIADTGNHNIGWNAVNGVDFQANYTWDMADWGLEDWGMWNTGVTGTYLIDNKSQLAGPGQIVNSLYHTPQAPAPSTATDIGGHLKYRVRLGWADDGWRVTGFMNFLPHFNSNTAALPPACFIQGNVACNASGLPQFAQYTTQYPTLSSLVPGLYTFDLNIGYNTGDKPANDYLKNVGIQLNVSNLLNKQAPYAYQIAPPGGQQSRAYFAITQGSSLGIDGRVYALTVTKVW